jgi:hypothetical protein
LLEKRGNKCPQLADIVAKVENRATQKISRKSISGPHCGCLACKRHYEGPSSILAKAIWSLTSPRVRRISGSKNFRSSPQKAFLNNICTFETCHDVRPKSVMRSEADMVGIENPDNQGARDPQLSAFGILPLPTHSLRGGG